MRLDFPAAGSSSLRVAAASAAVVQYTPFKNTMVDKLGRRYAPVFALLLLLTVAIEGFSTASTPRTTRAAVVFGLRRQQVLAASMKGTADSEVRILPHDHVKLACGGIQCIAKQMHSRYRGLKAEIEVVSRRRGIDFEGD